MAYQQDLLEDHRKLPDYAQISSITLISVEWRHLSKGASDLYLCLISHQWGPDRGVWPGIGGSYDWQSREKKQPGLAERMGTTRKSVKRYRAELEAGGFLTVEARHDEKGRQTSNLYTLVDPPSVRDALEREDTLRGFLARRTSPLTPNRGPTLEARAAGVKAARAKRKREEGQPLTPQNTGSVTDPPEGVSHCPPRGGQPLTPLEEEKKERENNEPPTPIPSSHSEKPASELSEDELGNVVDELDGAPPRVALQGGALRAHLRSEYARKICTNELGQELETRVSIAELASKLLEIVPDKGQAEADAVQWQIDEHIHNHGADQENDPDWLRSIGVEPDEQARWYEEELGRLRAKRDELADPGDWHRKLTDRTPEYERQLLKRVKALFPLNSVTRRNLSRAIHLLLREGQKGQNIGTSNDLSTSVLPLSTPESDTVPVNEVPA